MSYTTGKYLPQQTLINASGLLQTASGANLATQTALAQAASSHLPPQQTNQNQSALTTAALAAAYGLNQAQQHHHHQQQQQQQQQQQHQQQQHMQQQTTTINGHANNLSQTATMNGMPTSVNGNNIQAHNSAMLLPFLQNLSDDVS